MFSVYLYIWTWIEFYTITLIHPDFDWFLSKKLSDTKILFHSCSKESPLNWAQALRSLCANKKEKREQFRTFLLLTPSPQLLLLQHWVCFLSLTLAVKLKFLQSTQRSSLEYFLKAVVSYKVLYFSAEAAVIVCCKGHSWFLWSLTLDLKYLRLFQEQELTSPWSISKL